MRVMEAQGEDPRALYLRDTRLDVENGALLRRAAEMGFAPAQYALGSQRSRRRYFLEGTEWLEKAAAQGYRVALFSKACSMLRQEGIERALPLLQMAAALHDPNAEWSMGCARLVSWTQSGMCGTAGPQNTAILSARWSGFCANCLLPLSETIWDKLCLLSGRC
jgi:hypothetical protein